MNLNNQSKTTLINYPFQNQHLIWNRIINKSAQGEEANFESCLLSCYNFVNPDKIVHSITLQKHKPLLSGGLNIWIGVPMDNSSHRKIR